MESIFFKLKSWCFILQNTKVKILSKKIKNKISYKISIIREKFKNASAGN